LCGVGDVEARDSAAVAVDEPFDEGTRFNRQMNRLGQRGQEGVDLLDALGGGFKTRDDLPGRIDGGERDGAFVQIDADEGLEAGNGSSGGGGIGLGGLAASEDWDWSRGVFCAMIKISVWG